jgi:hypothetical protein
LMVTEFLIVILLRSGIIIPPIIIYSECVQSRQDTASLEGARI